MDPQITGQVLISHSKTIGNAGFQAQLLEEWQPKQKLDWEASKKRDRIQLGSDLQNFSQVLISRSKMTGSARFQANLVEAA